MSDEIALEARSLFFADTPLQVFNATMLAAQLSNTSTSDILLVDQFEGCKKIARRLRQSSYFATVYEQKPLSFSSANDRRFKNAGIHLGKRYLNLDYLRDIRYDMLFVACPTPTSNEVLLELRNANPYISTALYEDGTGSYNGNVLRGVSYIDCLFKGCEPNTLKAEFQVSLFRALGKGRTLYKPQGIYLYRPGNALLEYGFPKRQLVYSDCCAAALKDVFECDASVLEASDIVILDSVRQEGEEDSGADTVDSFLSGLSGFHGNVSFKMHPRSLRVPKSAESLALLDGFWELQCAECDMTDKVLVGVASSAMMSPVTMFGKEPTLVFLFDIVASISDSRKALFRAVYEAALSLYLDKSKVLAPKTMEEAISVLNQVGVVMR